jgi:hypothetical protein
MELFKSAMLPPVKVASDASEFFYTNRPTKNETGTAFRTASLQNHD